MWLLQTLNVLILSVALVIGNKESQGTLKIDELSVKVVAGSYVQTYQKTTIGVRFISTPDSLFVEDLQGNLLLRASEPVGGSLRLIELGRDQFIQQKTEVNGVKESIDWAVPKSHPIKLENTTFQQEQQLSLSIRRVNHLDRNVHQKIWEKSVRNILSNRELDLLKDAAQTMGSQDIIGADYPSIMPFYMSILQLEKVKQQNIGTSNSTSTSHSPLGNYRYRRSACLSDCPPCPNDECLGMCGYSCNCWRFLCGDCCYHLGCYQHDLCCRDRFSQSLCLFPFLFRCGRPYSC